MMMNRRAFLASVSAAAVVPLLPAISAPAPAIAVEALKPATTIWVGGHDGEFDWHPFHAETKEDAIQQLLNFHGRDFDVEGREYTLEEAHLSLERAAKMDGLQVDEIKGHHWIRAGFGSFCERCDGECFADNGGRAVGEEVVCEDCMTITDLLKGDKWDIELAEERVVEMMIDHDCSEGEVFEVLARSNDMNAINPAFWVKCLGEARKWA